MSDNGRPFGILPMALPGFKKRPQRDKKYGGFNRRMMAVTIDSLLLMPFLVPFCDKYFPIRFTEMQQAMGELMQEQRLTIGVLLHLLHDHGWMHNAVAQLVLFCIASGICWHFWSATPGKMLFRLRIVDAVTEQRITLKQILLRMLGYMISGLSILGIVWIGIDKRRQGWHDKMAGTVVIAIPWKKSRSDSAAVDPSNSPAPSATV